MGLRICEAPKIETPEKPSSLQVAPSDIADKASHLLPQVTRELATKSPEAAASELIAQAKSQKLSAQELISSLGGEALYAQVPGLRESLIQKLGAKTVMAEAERLGGSKGWEYLQTQVLVERNIPEWSYKKHPIKVPCKDGGHIIRYVYNPVAVGTKKQWAYVTMNYKQAEEYARKTGRQILSPEETYAFASQAEHHTEITYSPKKYDIKDYNLNYQFGQRAADTDHNSPVWGHYKNITTSPDGAHLGLIGFKMAGGGYRHRFAKTVHGFHHRDYSQALLTADPKCDYVDSSGTIHRGVDYKTVVAAHPIDIAQTLRRFS